MPTAHILHGFNVADGGKGTIDRIIPFLRKAGFDVKEHDYGWRGLLGVRLFNTETAADVANQVKSGDIAVGHSNGCAILYEASFMCRFAGLVFINPALDPDKTPRAEWTHVYHNEDDNTVNISRFLLWHPWGEMGQIGYTGDSDKVINYDQQAAPSLPIIKGHSEVFTSPKWLKYISKNAREAWES